MTTVSKQKTGRKRGNNEGSIRRRADVSWEGRVSLPDGQRKSYYGQTRADVQRKMTAGIRSLHQGLPVPTGRQTFGQFLDRWLADVVKPNTRHFSHAAYESIVRLHVAPALGRYSLEEITPQRIQHLMNAKRNAGFAPSTVARIRGVIRTALNQALRWGLVARNAAMLVEPPRRRKKEPAYLTATEACILMESVRGDRLEPIIVLALATGLRRGEVLGLRWSDVDLDGGRLHVCGQYQKIEGVWNRVDLKSKTARRTLALPPFVVSALRVHRTRQLADRLAAGPLWEDWDLLFPATRGEPMNPTALSVLFRRRVKRAGVTAIPFHGLRHSAATLLLAQGLTLGEIQKVMGHSGIQLTSDLYAHFAPEIAQRAADRMEAVFAAG